MELLDRGVAIAENLNEITIAVRRILEPIERGEGLVGRLLTDPEFGRKGVDALGKSLENFERLSTDIVNARGTLGRLIYDRELAAKIDDLGRAIEGFAGVLDALGQPGGVLAELGDPQGQGAQALQDLRAASAALRRTAERLDIERGLLGRLLHDDAYSEALAQDLARTLHNTAEITEKVNRGDGTLGALVNDRALIDAAEEIVSGVDDSKFARWLLRHYRKKGIQAADDDDAPPTDPD
jgi:hypothetical protein